MSNFDALHSPLPDLLLEKMSKNGFTQNPPIFALKSDLTHDRRLGDSFLIITKSHLITAEDDVREEFELAAIKNVRVEELFGSSRLVAEMEGGDRHLIYYSKALVPDFGLITRVLNDMLAGKQPELPEQEGPVHCERCGRPLTERGGNCTACVPKMAVFKRILTYLLPYKPKLILLILGTFFGVALQMAPPYITKRIVDDVIQIKDPSNLWFWILLMVLTGVSFLFVRGGSGVLSSWLSARLIADLRSQLHGHVQRLQMAYFGKRSTGEIVSRVMHDTGALQHFLIDGLPHFAVNVISLIVIAVILSIMDWKLALLVYLPVPFLVGGVKWFWNRLFPLFHKHGSRISALHSILSESIKGVKAIKAATQEGGRSNLFSRSTEDVFQTVTKIEKNWVGFSESTYWIMSLGVAAMWFFGAWRIANGDATLTLGDLLAFHGYIWLFYGPLQWFTAILNWMTQAFAGAERIFTVLDTKPEVYDKPNAVEIPRIRGEIAFEDVRFSYERGKEVIKGMDFKIEPGEMIGLVGKSGAGKSTIINLICRFYSVDSGLIRIDGHPIADVKLENLRRQIGIVMQEPFIFRASILENIRAGAPEADFADVVRAARAANAHEFIVDKEFGYDTIIGDNGLRLSGGERQRIAIARAILHDPPILILDEATSSVDSETEKAIQEAITRLVSNRTTIAIAHRLATLRNANRLVVVEDGKIAEIGTHEELLSKEDGIYAKLVKTQAEINKLRSEAEALSG